MHIVFKMNVSFSLSFSLSSFILTNVYIKSFQKSKKQKKKTNGKFKCFWNRRGKKHIPFNIYEKKNKNQQDFAKYSKRTPVEWTCAHCRVFVCTSAWKKDTRLTQHTKMVFESIVTDLMNRFLGDFIENLDHKQLNIGIWGGKCMNIVNHQFFLLLFQCRVCCYVFSFNTKSYVRLLIATIATHFCMGLIYFLLSKCHLHMAPAYRFSGEWETKCYTHIHTISICSVSLARRFINGATVQCRLIIRCF